MAVARHKRRSNEPVQSWRYITHYFLEKDRSTICINSIKDLNLLKNVFVGLTDEKKRRGKPCFIRGRILLQFAKLMFGDLFIVRNVGSRRTRSNIHRGKLVRVSLLALRYLMLQDSQQGGRQGCLASNLDSIKGRYIYRRRITAP